MNKHTAELLERLNLVQASADASFQTDRGVAACVHSNYMMNQTSARISLRQ